jgi:hypothetical protein
MKQKYVITFICDSCASEFEKPEGIKPCVKCKRETCNECGRPFGLCHDCFENENLGIKMEVEKVVADTMKKIFPMFNERESGSFNRVCLAIGLMVDNYIGKKVAENNKKVIDKSRMF